MITSSFLYLFILAFIATSINILKSNYNLKIFNYIPAIILVFLIVAFLSVTSLFEFNQEIREIYTLTLKNLIPAMIFLFLLGFDVVTFLKGKSFNEIGCACKIGAKQYWFLIALSLFISLLTQILSNSITTIDTLITTIIISVIFGIIGSFTKLKELNGSSEVATTMLYMFVAIIASNLSEIF